MREWSRLVEFKGWWGGGGVILVDFMVVSRNSSREPDENTKSLSVVNVWGEIRTGHLRNMPEVLQLEQSFSL